MVLSIVEMVNIGIVVVKALVWVILTNRASRSEKIDQIGPFCPNIDHNQRGEIPHHIKTRLPHVVVSISLIILLGCLIWGVERMVTTLQKSEHINPGL